MLRTLKVRFTLVFAIVLTITLVAFSALLYGYINQAFPKIGMGHGRNIDIIIEGYPGLDDLQSGVQMRDRDSIVEIAEYIDSQRKLEYSQLIITLLIPTVLLSGAIAYATAYYLLRPINRLREDLTQIDGKDMSKRIPDRASSSEVEYLQDSFNTLLGKLEAAFESQEEFIQDAAHELRTPLASMKAHLDLLNQNGEVTVKDYEEAFDVLNRMSAKLIKLSEDLLFLDRRKQIDIKPLALWSLVEEVIEMMTPLLNENGVKIKTNYSFKGKVNGDNFALTRVIKNIVENAIKYSGKSPKIDINLTNSKETANLVIRDYGIGIDKKDLDSVFSRFYRGSKTSDIDGTGLGLAIVKKIIEDHKGEVSIESQKGSGTTVSISLPLASKM